MYLFIDESFYAVKYIKTKNIIAASWEIITVLKSHLTCYNLNLSLQN